MAEEKKQQATARAEQELTQLLHGKIDPDHVLHGTEFIRNFYQLMNRECADTDLRSALFASDMPWRNQILAKIDGMISKNLDIIKSGDDHSPMLRYQQIVRLARLRNGFPDVLGKWDEDKLVALRDEIAKAWRGWLDNTQSRHAENFQVAAALVMLHDDPSESIVSRPNYGNRQQLLGEMLFSDALSEIANDPDSVSRAVSLVSIRLIQDGVIFGPFLEAACQNAIAGSVCGEKDQFLGRTTKNNQLSLTTHLQKQVNKLNGGCVQDITHLLGTDTGRTVAEHEALLREKDLISQVLDSFSSMLPPWVERWEKRDFPDFPDDGGQGSPGF